MIVTTTAQVEGHPIVETKGQVFGVIVRSRRTREPEDAR